jgi:serine protease
MKAPIFAFGSCHPLAGAATRLYGIAALLLLLAAHAGHGLAEEGRVIVKYRATPENLRQALALDRAAGLATRTGLALRGGRHVDARTQVLRAGGVSSAVLAARLRREADVEYAVPDQLRQARALPNDPLFSGQWHLRTDEIAATHMSTAWDRTTGAADVVVAVVDTGVRYDHPDLAARLLPGYDFVSDAANAGDGDGRDADASDPGDYISLADLSNLELQLICGAALFRHNSSWHGTRVAGVAAASSNNSIGIAGATWNNKLLPIRVLGKCGGYDSDIMAGMRWAAGLTVPGIPDNPNPARVINISLGGGGTCNAAYQDTVSELTGQKVLVVVSAGNQTGPVQTPANCPGVLAVGGVRHIGTKVGYSSLGPEIGISAPAGNCVNTAGLCLFSIQTTTNLGTTQPGTSAYTDQSSYNVGTSFASPQVAATAALMRSLNPALEPAELITRIQQSARAFPATDDSIPICPEVSTTGDSIGQCHCTTATCGAGLLDAAAAVTAAALPTARIQALDPLIAGGLIRLDAGDSMAIPAYAIRTWQWQLLSAPAGASLTTFDTEMTALQAVAAGAYQIRLTVTDDHGGSASTEISLNVDSAPPPPEPPAPADEGGGGGALDWSLMLGLAGLVWLARRGKRQA